MATLRQAHAGGCEVTSRGCEDRESHGSPSRCWHAAGALCTFPAAGGVAPRASEFQLVEVPWAFISCALAGSPEDGLERSLWKAPALAGGPSGGLPL